MLLLRSKIISFILSSPHPVIPASFIPPFPSHFLPTYLYFLYVSSMTLRVAMSLAQRESGSRDAVPGGSLSRIQLTSFLRRGRRKAVLFLANGSRQVSTADSYVICFLYPSNPTLDQVILSQFLACSDPVLTS